MSDEMKADLWRRWRAGESISVISRQIGKPPGSVFTVLKHHEEWAIEAFAKTYGAKFPKAVAKITEDRDELLAFYDFPAEHWIHQPH
jgi:hypothetical protein